LDRGLATAIDAECRRFSSPALQVELQASNGLDDLPPTIEIAAYRIVAESLANVVKHANATHCRIGLTAHPTRPAQSRLLTLAVVDDENGFEESARLGIGVDSMRERAEELGGTFHIGQTMPCGTRSRVRIPVAAGSVPQTATVREPGALSESRSSEDSRG
jgi:two-component system, NarL family, sensor kinase